MAPKARGGGGGGGGGGSKGAAPKAKGAADLDRRKDELVAVVLADSFAQVRGGGQGESWGARTAQRERGERKRGTQPRSKPAPPPLIHPSISIQTFRPITLETPKALLPLAGAPLLDYALEWLAGAGCVDEVVVVACAHARQVEAHLGAAGWIPPRSGGGGAGGARASSAAHAPSGAGGRAGPATRVSLVSCPTARSAGDALRELDVRGTLAGASDFVLLHGDVVTNADLGAALASHRARRAGPDPGCVATLIVSGGVTPAARARLGEAAALYTVDAASGRLLAFDDVSDTKKGSSSPSPSSSSALPPPLHLRVDARAFGERDALALRADLSRPHVALCGPEVLVAFADNFDFQALESDFIPGTLAEEELGHRLYLHIATAARPSAAAAAAACASGSAGAYLVRVTCLRSYDAVSRDVLQRWAWPLAPDTNLLTAPSGGGGAPASPSDAPDLPSSDPAPPHVGPAPDPLATSYRAGRQFTYREAGVRLERGAVLGPDAAAGAGATLGAGAVVRCSILGRGATVGAAARVSGSYLLAGASVGPGATVAGSLLCEGAIVGRGAVVGPGVVLGRRCVVAPGAVVPPGQRISLFRRIGAADGEDGSSDEEGEAGQGSEGGGEMTMRTGSAAAPTPPPPRPPCRPPPRPAHPPTWRRARRPPQPARPHRPPWALTQTSSAGRARGTPGARRPTARPGGWPPRRRHPACSARPRRGGRAP